MKTVKGDLIKLALQGEFDVIVHGCNCFRNMGAGIARQIAKMFPEALSADKATTCGAFNKLGTYSVAHVIIEDRELIIINAYTQYKYGKGLQADYKAIEKVFKEIAKDFPDYTIGIPKIGAGLAGGDWNTIKGIIESMSNASNITYVEYDS